MHQFTDLKLREDGRLIGNVIYSAVQIGQYVYVSKGSFFFNEVTAIPENIVLVKGDHSYWSNTFKHMTEEGIAAGLIRGEMEVVKR